MNETNSLQRTCLPVEAKILQCCWFCRSLGLPGALAAPPAAAATAEQHVQWVLSGANELPTTAARPSPPSPVFSTSVPASAAAAGVLFMWSPISVGLPCVLERANSRVGASLQTPPLQSPQHLPAFSPLHSKAYLNLATSYGWCSLCSGAREGFFREHRTSQTRQQRYVSERNGAVFIALPLLSVLSSCRCTFESSLKQNDQTSHTGICSLQSKPSPGCRVSFFYRQPSPYEVIPTANGS